MEPTTVMAGGGLVLKLVKELAPRLTELRNRIPPEWREQIEDVSGRVYEIQTEVLNAREREVTLSERCRKLEDDLRRAEDWEAEKARYRLREIVKKVYVYELKPECAKGDEPEHFLCAKCFHEGRILHLQKTGYADDVLSCWRCERSLTASDRGPYIG